MSTSEQQSSVAGATSPDGGDVAVFVKAPGDTRLNITISKTCSVAELKKVIADKTDPRIEAESQRLIYSGRVLKDEQTIAEYQIQTGHTIHLVKGAVRSHNTPSASQVPTNLNAGQQIAGNPLAPLLNATNQIPAFNPFADMGLNPNDPNMAMDMMNNPQVLASMQRLLEDPQMVDQIIASDPRLQSMPGIRELMRSPHFRQMVFNPDIMQQMQQLMQAGGTGFGGAGLSGAGSFPPAGAFGTPASTTPGTTGATEQTGTPATAGQNAPPPNPFAMFGGGAAGADGLGMLNTPMGQMMMQRMMGGGLPGGAAGAVDTRPPEERFEVQLGQLQGMGFTNARQNVQALQASGGNVEAAIEYLLSGN